MILRRITEHVKAQNWTAVALDFVIVVVGVFIGIQVSNWNNGRIDRKLENELLMRLHGETQELIQQRQEDAVLPRRRKEVLKTVQISLLDSNSPRLFDGEECITIQLSHILRRPPDTLPTLEEMVSSGRIGLISNPSIRRQLTRYLHVRERARYVYDELVADVFRLAHLYPQYFGRELVLWGQASVDGYNRFEKDPLSDEITVLNKCYSEGMRSDPGFLSDIEDNYARINAYIGGVVETLDIEARKLEEVLIAELEIPTPTDGKK